MTPEELVAQVNKRARDIFKSGLNYAECVPEALLHQVPTAVSDDRMCLLTGCDGGGGIGDDICGCQPFQENGEGLN